MLDEHTLNIAAGSREQANSLLRALAEHLGGADALELDETDAVRLSLGGFLFVLAYSRECEELISVAYIAPLPRDERRPALIRQIMEGNYAWAGTGGGILGLDEDSGYLCLSRRHVPGSGNASDFIRAVAGQYTLCGYWRGRLEPEQNVPAGSMRI